MFKNVAGQKVRMLAIDTATNKPKTGDAANITAYLSKDYGTVTALGDTSATEEDATNAKGIFLFDVTQSEINCDVASFTGKSSTSGVEIIPVTIYPRPANFTAFALDSSGRVQIQSGTSTGQLDMTSGVVKANATQFAGQTITAAAGVTIPSSIASPTNITAATGVTLAATTHAGAVIPTVTTVGTLTTYTGNTPQSGDAFLRLGAPAGASVSADVAAVKSDTGTLTSRITSTLFSGITQLSKWLGALAGKTADSSTLTEINATTAGASYNNTTDSQEALRDRGDAAWITATGFSTLDAAGVRLAVGLAAANLDVQLSDMPTNAELSSALASSDDATLAAIAGLNNLSSADAQAAAAAALTAYGTAKSSDVSAVETAVNLLAADIASILNFVGTTGVVLSAAQMNKIADHVFRRAMASIESSSSGDALGVNSLYGFVQMGQGSAVSGNTLTVYKTDGTTVLGTKNVATSASAEPITGVS